MLGFTAEQATAAIVAALIAFAGVVLSQIVGAVMGARYAANMTRRTQLELADITFQRQWRERLVRPFLELADKRVAALADFSEAAGSVTSNEHSPSPTPERGPTSWPAR